MEGKYKIGELAAVAGLTVRTLRYYDQIDLLSPSAHSGSGHRLYDKNDFFRLQQILALKELEVSLEEIKSILNDNQYNPLDFAWLQITRIKKNINAQQKLLKALLNVAGHMEKEEKVSVKDFSMLLSMMNKHHEEFLTERKGSIERSLDRLGDFLTEKA
ncbi:MerR family transcriptional regulator [Fictibacillus terranigra]|uniref:MerR family transcriptional regulator n=1 Tax=Fictibacillus terranigra TaxID=3058424 RepID=A0ABT8EBB9_9BACL|nr:MerR family transcriptional regulator [Fictibacillus sp. CENA-BCM004]MDN4075157.1 MerR family transcriptional regulator [Fictibacillus sp. CENA-BCM004]